MMIASDVIVLYRALETIGVAIWIDGGWGIDALLGRETRPHNDVDIVIQQKDLSAFQALVRAQGYRDLPKPDTRDWDFVLTDVDGREIDVHVIVFDAAGNGIYGPADRGEMYPAAALTGTGTIAGVRVRCTSAAFQVQSHTGYEPRPFDAQDVAALCEKYGLPVPAASKAAKDR